MIAFHGHYFLEIETRISIANLHNPYFSEGHMRPIALYEPDGEKLNFYCRMCEPIIWQGMGNVQQIIK